MAAKEPNGSILEEHRMVTIECPWCDEPAHMDESTHPALVCEGCSIRAEIAPEPPRQLDRAA